MPRLGMSSLSPAAPAGARKRRKLQPLISSPASTFHYIRRFHVSSRIASACTGGMILAASGVLDGGAATTKREVVPPETPPVAVMREKYPAIAVQEAMLVEREDGIVTGGGVTLCIDTTL